MDHPLNLFLIKASIFNRGKLQEFSSQDFQNDTGILGKQLIPYIYVYIIV